MTLSKRVDKIQKIREKNNQGWMDLLRLALEVAPERTKEILKGIVEKDKQVVAEVEKMLE